MSSPPELWAECTGLSIKASCPSPFGEVNTEPGAAPGTKSEGASHEDSDGVSKTPPQDPSRDYAFVPALWVLVSVSLLRTGLSISSLPLTYKLPHIFPMKFFV